MRPCSSVSSRTNVCHGCPSARTSRPSLIRVKRLEFNSLTETLIFHWPSLSCIQSIYSALTSNILRHRSTQTENPFIVFDILQSLRHEVDRILCPLCHFLRTYPWQTRNAVSKLSLLDFPGDVRGLIPRWLNTLERVGKTVLRSVVWHLFHPSGHRTLRARLYHRCPPRSVSYCSHK